MCVFFQSGDRRRMLPLTRFEAGYSRLGCADTLCYFSLCDAAGVTQAEVAERIGTTQSAVARLESGKGKHSPSIATLEKYAHALGCRLELRLVNEMVSRKVDGKTTRPTGRTKKLHAA